ncbi:MAG: DoxX family protein [Ignavibacteriae bacterium]|nr:DoxX family protein [Ignavibacteriota bacterium]
MSIFFKARGSSSFGLLVIRLIIGSTFLLAGAHKVMDIEAFINHVKSFGIFSPNASFILGFILPFIEIIFGAFYIIGIFTPLTSLALSVMTISFMVVSKNIATPAEQFVLPQIVFYLIMLSATLMTLFSGAGVMSFDALFDKKKKTETQNVSSPVPETVKPPEAIKDATFSEIVEEKKEEQNS